MKILITGGAGLIGYYLSLALRELGHDVLVYDNFSSYVDPIASNYHYYMSERIRNLKDLVQIRRGDVRNRHQVTETYQEFQPDVVVHLAAVANAKVFDVCPEEASETNLNGTVNCLEAVRRTPSVRRFVFASSSFVYGDFQSPTVDETHQTVPKDIYGGTKLSGEAMTQSFCRRLGIESVIVRPSAVYGPTDSNRRVSQIFIENAMQGRRLVLRGGADNRLDFTYVEDTAQGFALAALKTEAAGQVFNITFGQARSLREYVRILRGYLPEIECVEEPADPNRPSRGTLDISRARRLLGYEPRYPLEEGLRKYVAYVLERREALDLPANARKDPALCR